MKLDTNKTVSEIMQSYCVMVNSGSGVLVNAMTLEFSYVLTARHAVFEEPAKNVVVDHNQNPIEVLGVMVFPKVGQQEPLDCAILKIAHQAGLSQKSWNAANLPPMANLTFVGLPNAERVSATPIKHRTGQAASVVNDLITLELAGIPSKDVIQGMSGGGVYHIDNDYPFLVGVEFEMEATCLDHQYGRVDCHGLARYNQLLTLHSSAPMVPPHLECFSRVRDRIFAFNVYDPINVQNLKSALLGFADLLIESGMPPPYEIMKRYDVQLLLGKV
ncbi:ABC-three component system protein [Pseudomonas sp. CIP-10]|uniref:ABC-three component system protein n=1 Tax=Pseudomonas sp. CIP-10 TaxID=2892442 RepID=UPI001E5C1605|nr:ABC-three component system protein [Pseudomonas sp. CIP-10]UFH29252.1 serine protease [Pseudomonas sp. CIP-10]